MALEDFFEPEVGVAVVVTAAVASPRVRKAIRTGVVYGLAGLLMAGDKLKQAASGVTQKAREVMHQAENKAHEATAPGNPAPEAAPS
jgi:hypothetical protein